MMMVIFKALRFLATFFSLVAVLFVMTGCSHREAIAHDLDERDANEIVVFLSSKGMDVEKVKVETTGGGGGGAAAKWDISVPVEQRQQAMAVLSQAGLPRRPSQSLLEIFKDSGLVPSEMQQKIRYNSGLEEQISSIIRKMDGIVDADVRLSFPEEDPLNPNIKKGKVTAAVYVKHTGILDDPNSQLIWKIKNLVSGSVPDLSPDNVTVIPDRARNREAILAPAEEEGLYSGSTPLVSIWTLIIAKESVTRFRIIFFSFVVAVLILMALLALLVYKLVPVLALAKTSGSLLSLKRIEVADLTKKEEAKTSEASAKATKPSKQAKKVESEGEDDDDFDDDNDEDEDK